MELTEFTVTNSAGDFSRRVWLQSLPKPPEQLTVFLDGEFYLQKMGTPAVLQDLQKRGEIPSLACVYVSHGDAAARHVDLTCQAAFAQWITIDLIRWLHNKYPALPSGGHLIAGPSLGGLAAAHIALQAPQLFSRCLSHSGSFWWNNEQLTSALSAISAGGPRFWLSVGDREIQSDVVHPPTGLHQKVSQIAACEHFRDALLQQDCPVYFQQYSGGHEFAPWAAEIPAALRWLFSTDC